MPNDDADKLAVDTELTMVFIQDRALLYRIAYDILKDGAIAEEAVQDSYLKVYERSNRGHVHNARAYCAQTVRNTALDIQRRMMKQRASTSDLDVESYAEILPSAESGPEDRAYVREVLAAVNRTLLERSARHRRAFVLHVAEGKTQREIAGLMEISPALVNILLREVRETLLASEVCRSYLNRGEMGRILKRITLPLPQDG